MSLTLGRTFDREFSLRFNFLNGFYNLSVFFNKKSSFVLFSLNDDFPNKQDRIDRLVKVSMYKNLSSSKFCDTFLKLHTYRKTTLDILNQYNNIRPEYTNDVMCILNETVTMSKIILDNEDKPLYDILNLYVFTMPSYQNEFIFVIAERQNICRKLGRKIVRTTGLQISTTDVLSILDEYSNEKHLGKLAIENSVCDKNIDLEQSGTILSKEG